MKLNVLLAALALALLTGCGVNTSPGSGEKIGQIVKLNRQGMIRETWEAQLIRGGITDGSGAIGIAPFDFTIEDDKLAETCRKYMQAQTEVTITYRMEGIYSAFRTDSGGQFLIAVRPATNTVTKDDL